MMATGIPIAFAFLTVVLIGAYALLGGLVGLEQVILSITSTMTTFTLLPIPLFILMGDLMVQSGIGMKVIDVLNKWLGKVPGRLGIARGPGRDAVGHPHRGQHGQHRHPGIGLGSGNEKPRLF